VKVTLLAGWGQLIAKGHLRDIIAGSRRFQGERKSGMTDVEARAQERAHWAVFFRQWLKNPLRMASVVPSGQQLARRMVDAMPRGTRRVVELGAGTGVVTQALIRHGIATSDLLVVELNAALHALLKRRFPGVAVACSDARNLRELEALSPGIGRVDAVLSSLLAIPKDVQRDILASAFDVLRPGGVFIQYTYGLASPLDDGVARQLGLRCRSAGWAWRNLPPAQVFVYARASGTGTAGGTRPLGEQESQI
jgi:phosphatidylethanolamine/phosphatidyl-N-methylethanolamine N-methyltransferase